MKFLVVVTLIFGVLIAQHIAAPVEGDENKQEIDTETKVIDESDAVAAVGEQSVAEEVDVEDESELVQRAKKSNPTTVCVQIKPTNPYEKPYVMCKNDGYAAPSGYSNTVVPASGYSSGPSYGGSSGGYGGKPSGYSAPSHSSYSAPSKSSYGSSSSSSYGGSSSGGYGHAAAAPASYGGSSGGYGHAAPAYSAPASYGGSSSGGYGHASAAPASYGGSSGGYGHAAPSYSAPASYGSSSGGYGHAAAAPAYSAPASYGGSSGYGHAAPAPSYSAPASYGGSSGGYGHAAPSSSYGGSSHGGYRADEMMDEVGAAYGYGGYKAPSYQKPASYGHPAPAYSAPAYSAPAYSAPAYSAPAVYPGPSRQYSYASPAPTVPCSTNLLFSCQPHVAPVGCSAPSSSYGSSYGSSYSAPSYSAPSYSAPSYAPSYAPVPSYSAPAPAYAFPHGSYRNAEIVGTAAPQQQHQPIVQPGYQPTQSTTSEHEKESLPTQSSMDKDADAKKQQKTILRMAQMSQNQMMNENKEGHQMGAMSPSSEPSQGNQNSFVASKNW